MSKFIEALKEIIPLATQTADLEYGYKILNDRMRELARQVGIQFSVGDKVSFMSSGRGRIMLGTITKTNKQTAKVDCGSDGIWKVHYSYIRHTGTSETVPSTQGG